MATLTVQQIARTGIVPTLAAAGASGDKFANDGKTYFRVANGHATLSRTVTIASQLGAAAIPQGTAAANLSVVVAALTEKLIGPFDQNAFNDASGLVNVTYSSESDLTVGAYKL